MLIIVQRDTPTINAKLAKNKLTIITKYKKLDVKIEIAR